MTITEDFLNFVGAEPKEVLDKYTVTIYEESLSDNDRTEIISMCDDMLNPAFDPNINISGINKNHSIVVKNENNIVFTCSTITSSDIDTDWPIPKNQGVTSGSFSDDYTSYMSSIVSPVTYFGDLYYTTDEFETKSILREFIKYIVLITKSKTVITNHNILDNYTQYGSVTIDDSTNFDFYARLV